MFYTGGTSSEEDRVRVLAADQTARTLGLQSYMYLSALAQERDMSVGDLVLEAIKDLAAEAEDQFKHFTAAEMAVVLNGITRPRRAKGTRVYTEKAKEVYLEAMMDLCNNKLAMMQAGIRSPSLPYIWARDDPAFAERWNEARLFVGLTPLKKYNSRKVANVEEVE